MATQTWHKSRKDAPRPVSGVGVVAAVQLAQPHAAPMAVRAVGSKCLGSSARMHACMHHHYHCMQCKFRPLAPAPWSHLWGVNGDLGCCSGLWTFTARRAGFM